MIDDNLVEARRRVAARFAHDYHKRAIKCGDWDAGALVQRELAKVRAGE